MSQIQVTGEAKIRDLQGPVVANSGVITALDGLPSQYVRGDGTLADIPSVTGGGASVSYYLNGSVSQGTIGGSTYYQMSRDAITGTGTNFSTSTDGLLAQFITDAGDPDVSSIPSGNWNIEFFMNVSASSGSLASFYVEFYKYDGSTFTLIASNSATPEQLTNTTTVDAYYTSVAFAETALATTDRLAIRIYANVASKTVTLYTEDNRLCQIVTTFSKGLLSMNSLTDQEQYLTTGTSGTNFAIVSSGDTHTFNLPVASATNTGKLSSTDWSTFNNKVPYTGATESVDLGENTYIGGFVQANGTSVLSGTISLKQNGFIPAATGYATIGSVSAGKLGIYFGESGLKSVELQNDLLTASRTYDFPDASGTLALTSNLSGYVPYSGATSSVDLGVNSLLAGYISANGSGSSSGTITLKQNGTLFGGGSGELTIGSATAGELSIFFGNNAYKATFLNTSLTASRTYTLPDASGTIALTSNLLSYLPLAGGTLTGPLSGTSATFSGSVNTTNGILTIKTAAYGGLLQLESGTTTDKWLMYHYSPDNSFRMNYNGSGNDELIIASTGAATFSSSVGIGGSPSDTIGYGIALDVQSSSGAALYLRDSSNPTTQYGFIAYDGNDDGLKIQNQNSSGYIRLNTNGSERMRITSGGNVGIGTSSPANKLQVNSTSGDGMFLTSYLTTSGAADTGAVLGFGIYDGVFNRDAAIIKGLKENGTSGNYAAYLSFSTRPNGGSVTERMRITSGGFVKASNTGSYVNSTGSYHELRNNVEGNQVATFSTSASTAYGIQISYTNSSPNITSQEFIYCSDSSLSRFIVWSNGSVVNRTGSYGTISDAKYKENIIDATPKLADLMQLKVRNFNMIGDETKQIGFIAQEFEEVFPKMVDTSIDKESGDEYKSIKTSVLVPMLVKAIQEQQAQIELLSNKIVALESK